MTLVGPRPNLVLLAGPNGAGKTTAAPRLLRGALHVEEFVNADTIASGISAFRSEDVAIQAGRIMLRRLRQLTERRVSVAFETTMASRSFAPWIERLITNGYAFRVVFLWLPSPELAISRVRVRVKRGGHGVPDTVVRQRYNAGLRNFFRLYRPLATSWIFCDVSDATGQRIIAQRAQDRATSVRDPELWSTLEKRWG